MRTWNDEVEKNMHHVDDFESVYTSRGRYSHLRDTHGQQIIAGMGKAAYINLHRRLHGQHHTGYPTSKGNSVNKSFSMTTTNGGHINIELDTVGHGAAFVVEGGSPIYLTPLEILQLRDLLGMVHESGRYAARVADEEKRATKP